MAVEDVPSGGDEAAAMTHPVQCVCVDLKVALTVCFRGKGWQTDETDEWTLAWRRTEEQRDKLVYRKEVGWWSLSGLLCV